METPLKMGRFFLNKMKFETLIIERKYYEKQTRKR